MTTVSRYNFVEDQGAANQTGSRSVQVDDRRVTISAEQCEVFTRLKAGKQGDQRAHVYIGLCATPLPGGKETLGLVPGNSEASWARLNKLLDAAAQVWGGENLGPSIAGEDSSAKLRSFAALVDQVAQSDGLTDASITAIRAKVLKDPRDLGGKDIFERGAVTFPSLAKVANQSIDLPVVVLPPADSHESIFNTSYPRLMAEIDPEWDPKIEAEKVLKERNNKKILDAWYRLHPTNRQEFATAYADLKGWGLSGADAVAKTQEDLNRRLDGRSKLLLNVYIKNPSGQAEAADSIALDLKGWRENGEAICQTLMLCKSAAQLAALEKVLQDRYGMSFADVSKELGKLFGASSLEQRRFDFLIGAIKANGQVTDAHLRAFELREAARNPNIFERKEMFSRGGTDENRIFRMHEQMSAQEFLETAAAYKELNDTLWKETATGNGGETGIATETALYHMLHDELDKDVQYLQRLALVCQKGPGWGAQYIAITIRMAGQKKIDNADLMAAIKLISANPKHTLGDGMPTGTDVQNAYLKLFGANNIMEDIRVATRGVEEELAVLAIKGHGMASPEAAALRIVADPDDAYQALDAEASYAARGLPVPTEAQRQEYVAQVKAAFAERTGRAAESTGKELEEFLGAKLGTTLEQNGRIQRGPRGGGNVAGKENASGRKTRAGRVWRGDRGQRRQWSEGVGSVPSRAVRLLERGALTPGEKLFYAMNERGTLGVFNKEIIQTINETLGGLSPLQKLGAMSEYAKLKGGEFNLQSGQNPLIEDLQSLHGRDLRHADLVAQILPQELDKLMLEMTVYLTEPANPEVKAWIRKNIGDPEEWRKRNFTGGVDDLMNMLKTFGSVEAFAKAAVVDEEVLLDEVGTQVGDATGSHLSQVILGISTHAVGVEDAARALGVAVDEAARYEQEFGQMTEQQVAQIQRTYANLVRRLSQCEELKGKRIELVSKIALTVGLAGITAVSQMPTAPRIFLKIVKSPISMGVVGAALKGGTYLAFDNQDKIEVLLQALRGFASGALISVAGDMSMPDPVKNWFLNTNPGLAAGIQGSMMGATVGGGMGATEWVLEGAPSLDVLARNVFQGVRAGAITGFVASSVLHYAKQAFTRDNVNPNVVDDEPVITDDPVDKTKQPTGDRNSRGNTTQKTMGDANSRGNVDQKTTGNGPGSRTPQGSQPGKPPNIEGPNVDNPGGTTGRGSVGTPTDTNGTAATESTTGTNTNPTGGGRGSVGTSSGTTGTTNASGTTSTAMATSTSLPSDPAGIGDGISITLDPSLTGASTTPTTSVVAELNDSTAIYKSLERGWEIQAGGIAPLMTVKQGNIAYRAAYLSETHGKDNTMPSSEQVQLLMEHAKQSGLENIPNEVPKTPRQINAFLQSLKDQAVKRIVSSEEVVREPPDADDKVDIAALTEQLEALQSDFELLLKEGATSQVLLDNVGQRLDVRIKMNALDPSIKPTGEEWEMIVDDLELASGREIEGGYPTDDHDAATHTQALQFVRTKITGAIEKASKQELAKNVDEIADDTVPIDDAEVKALLENSPILGDADVEYVQQHLKSGLSLLYGVPETELGEDLGDLVDKLPQDRSVRWQVNDLKQNVLSTVGLEPKENNAEVDDRVLAAYDNLAQIFGPVVEDLAKKNETTVNEELVEYYDACGRAMLHMAKALGKDLPTGVTASQIRGLVGEGKLLTKMIQEYQKLLGVAQTGVFDLDTSSAHYNRLAELKTKENSAVADETGQAEVAAVDVQVITKALNALVGPDKSIDQVSVPEIIGHLARLYEAGKVDKIAAGTYKSQVNQVVGRLIGADVKRAALFAKHAPEGMQPILNDILYAGVYKRLDKDRQKELCRSLVEGGMTTQSMADKLPVYMLDALDNHFPVSSDVGDKIRNATLMKKDIHKALKEDSHSIVRTLTSAEGRKSPTGQRLLADIAKLDLNDAALKSLGRAVGSHYNTSGKAVVEAVKAIAASEGKPAKIASAIVVEALTSISWPWGDNFVRDFLGYEDKMNKSLMAQMTKPALDAMIKNLDPGWVLDWTTPGEKALITELEKLGGGKPSPKKAQKK